MVSSLGFPSYSMRFLYGWFSKIWSLFGYPTYEVPYYNTDPKRDHNFENHPYMYIYIYIHICATPPPKHPPFFQSPESRLELMESAAADDFRSETSNMGNTIKAYKNVDLWGGGGYHIYVYIYIYIYFKLLISNPEHGPCRRCLRGSSKEILLSRSRLVQESKS